MNRSDIVKSVARKAKITNAEADKAITALLEVIALSLACGEDVNLRTFGKFEPRLRNAVVRRNPKTGVEHKVPAKITVGFIPSPNLKDRLNG